MKMIELNDTPKMLRRLTLGGYGQRRLLAYILIVAMLFSLTACKICKHSYTSSITKEATCVEEGVKTFTCSKCGKTYTETIPKNDNHNYTSEITKEATVSETGIKTYTCTLCGHSYTETIEKIKSNWEIDYYIDTYGDKTDKGFAIGTFKGTFSNSATNGSDLTVYVYLEPKSYSATIRLLEYGRSKISSGRNDVIYINTKDSSGKEHFYYDAKAIQVYDGDLYVNVSEFRKAIENNEKLKIAITIGNREYRFATDNIGLSEVLGNTKK